MLVTLRGINVPLRRRPVYVSRDNLSRPGHYLSNSAVVEIGRPDLRVELVHHTGMGYTDGMAASYAKDKKALLGRLSRIEGQARGVARMVTEDAYCIDVLTQINAIKAAIDQVGLLLLEDHINGCVVTSVQQGDRSKVDELVRAVERFAKA
jgi:DNA-binding FrmR family transcriptional regulator